MTKQKGIPYDIIGNGIMVAKAEDIRRCAQDQFDKCNEWFNKQIHRIAATKENNMSELELKLCHLQCRKDELEGWLQDVNTEIETIKTEIAKDNKIIRHQDFMVAVDPPSGTWVVKHGTGCLVTHKLSNLNSYCNEKNSQHNNKNIAYINLINKLKEQGWKDQDEQ